MSAISFEGETNVEIDVTSFKFISYIYLQGFAGPQSRVGCKVLGNSFLKVAADLYRNQATRQRSARRQQFSRDERFS